jgi:hypothetical protein
MPLLLIFTKEIFKNTKENMPSEEICSHFSQEGQINLIFHHIAAFVLLFP